MIEVFIVYNEEKQIEKVREFKGDSLTFNFIDINTRKGKKEGWSLKNYYGAKLNPFILIKKDDKPIKAFYSETGENTIQNLLNFLDNENN